MTLRLSVLLVLAVILTASTGLAGNASAQEIVIETSASDHDNKFFGEGILQVVISDNNADDDENDTINVDIKAEGEATVSDDFQVPNTNEGSQRFEFFLVHVDSNFVNGTGLDPINNKVPFVTPADEPFTGAEGPPIITFGDGGDLDTDDDLYEDITFTITVGNEELTIDYEETASALRLDRDSYGTTSYVYITIVDQDANLNPTDRDEFIVNPESDPNDDLLVLSGGTFENAITFRETGDNTAEFEGRYRLGESILADSESLSLTLFDKANYENTLAAPENDSNNTDEISFTVGNSDGTVSIGGGQQPIVTFDPLLESDKDSYGIGENVFITVSDQDANLDPSAIESIQLRVSSGGSEIGITAFETTMNTGEFEASFQLAEETDQLAGTIAPGGLAAIIYTDKRPAGFVERVKAGQEPEEDFILEIDIQLPVKTGIEATDVTAPVAKDAAGGSGPYAVGASVTISTTISNNNDGPQPFMALIEARNGEGMTVFLALRSGTLEPLGSTDMGVLWQPDKSGAYMVRTFVITSLDAGAEVLSPVASSEITIT